MKYVVDIVGLVTVTGEDGTPAQDVAGILDKHLDLVMDELDNLDAQDPSIDLDLNRGEVGFSVMVEASNPLIAVNNASSIIRAAVHAAHGATPDWPGPRSEAWSVRLVSVKSGLVVADADSETDEREREFALQ